MKDNSNIRFLIILFLFILIYSCTKREAESPIVTANSSGPENGTLLIGGGGMTDELWEIFNTYGGGENSKLVVIPTSWDDNSIKSDPTFSIIIRQFKNRGFREVTILHTKDPEIANTDSFVEPLKDATAVWLTGGRQWRTADVYLSTKVQEELFKLLERGGIIGGHSAGASIQGSYLVRGRRDENGGYYISGGQETGFGFLKNTAIDQHHIIRNRQFDMFELLEMHPELLGIGIDENTAILVQNNKFEVVGDSYVAIYDGTYWSPYLNEIEILKPREKKFYYLSNGDQYDLVQRHIINNKFRNPQENNSSNKKEYIGKYQLGNARCWFNVYIKNETLIAQRTLRTITNNPIILFPYEKDLFFDKESYWWFQFIRNNQNQVVGLEKKYNRLINDNIKTFTKIE